MTPLTSDPLKKRSTFSSREDEISYFRELFSFVAVSCSCREWTRGIEDFALAFWLAPFQFRVVFFFFLYVHTHSLPSWFFFLLRGVVYCRALLSLSLAFLSSLDFYLNGESDHYSFRVRFRRLKMKHIHGVRVNWIVYSESRAWRNDRSQWPSPTRFFLFFLPFVTYTLKRTRPNVRVGVVARIGFQQSAPRNLCFGIFCFPRLGLTATNYLTNGPDSCAGLELREWKKK